MQVVAIMFVGWMLILASIFPQELEIIFFFFSILGMAFVAAMPKLVKPIILRGQIKQYEESNERGKFLKNVTFLDNKGERKFFKKMVFSKAIWGTLSTEKDMIFFINIFALSSQKISVWACSIPKISSISSLELMGKPKKRHGLFFFVLLFFAFILFLSIKDIGEKFFIIYIVMTICVYILHIKSFKTAKERYKERLDLLSKYGVPHPLG